MPILALSCGVATSQTAPSRVLSTQVQLGDVFAEQTLDVVTADETVGAVTTAMGNGLTTGGSRRDLDVNSYQELRANVQGHTVINAEGKMGDVASTTTAATGNTSDNVMIGGTLTAVQTQYVGPQSIYANGQIEGEEALAGDLTHATQAVANSQTYSMSDSAMGMRASQTNEAEVLADGGAIVGESTGQATVTANAAGNNLTTAGINSSQRIVAAQANSGDLVQASKFTAYGQTYVANTNASATANNINATNQGPLLDLTSYQDNSSYVRAQAEGTAALFSSHTVTAYGAGNSTLAGNMGGEVVLDNTQFNGGGGVEVIAVADGTTGWDNAASASAAGNAVTAYACSSCQSKMTVDNTQQNDAEVASRTTARIGGSGRSVTGISSAVGNTASFYVSSPQ